MIEIKTTFRVTDYDGDELEAVQLEGDEIPPHYVGGVSVTAFNAGHDATAYMSPAEAREFAGWILRTVGEA